MTCTVGDEMPGRWWDARWDNMPGGMICPWEMKCVGGNEIPGGKWDW